MSQPRVSPLATHVGTKPPRFSVVGYGLHRHSHQVCREVSRRRHVLLSLHRSVLRSAGATPPSLRTLITLHGRELVGKDCSFRLFLGGTSRSMLLSGRCELFKRCRVVVEKMVLSSVKSLFGRNMKSKYIPPASATFSAVSVSGWANGRSSRISRNGIRRCWDTPCVRSLCIGPRIPIRRHWTP